MDLIPDGPTLSSKACFHMYSYGLFKKMNYVCYVIVIKIKGSTKCVSLMQIYKHYAIKPNYIRYNIKLIKYIWITFYRI